MAKQKKEDPPKGSPAWMATFSDLMNLLLCFFVLLFSMSSVDENKFEALIASLQSQYSILKGGGASVGQGKMISAGINQLQKYDVYFNPKAMTNGDGRAESDEKNIVQSGADNDGQNNKPHEGESVDNGAVKGDGEVDGEIGKDDEQQEKPELTEKEARDLMEAEELQESQQMSDKVERLLKKNGIQDQVKLEFNGQHVTMTLNGAILFASGSSELSEKAYPLVDKIGVILKRFPKHTIEVEGHTDNVPVHNAKYADNNVLSMYRALSVADYLRAKTNLNPADIKSSGRGDYVPIADNATAQGRAQNRRVEIKIYNSYNSDNKK